MMHLKYILCLLILLVTISAYCDNQADFKSIVRNAIPPQAITASPNSSPSKPYLSSVYQTKLLFYGLMAAYQNFISSQNEPSCMFTPSCSEFTKLAFAKYGLLGIIMGSDRVQRCNGLGAVYYHHSNKLERHIHDPIENYILDGQEPVFLAP